MVQECFGLAGWEADMLVEPTTSELLDHVAGTAIDLLGLTVSSDAHIERLPALIRAVRSVSMNQHIRIMVGGRACNAHGGIAALVGADGTAASAPDAVALAERLVRAARAAAG
jgi:methanogenic corrinoid protein MtbC1